jgi:ATP-dependent Clp protease ATP-binding subunit ClpC
MNEEIRTLIDSLRRGQYEDPAEKIDLLAAALREHGADVPLLLSLLRAPQIPLRLAAIEACRGRTDAETVTGLLQLADDPEGRVRRKLASALGAIESKPADGALRTLIQDSDDEVRAAALKSSSGKPAFIDLQAAALESDSDWDVRLAAGNALGEQKIPLVVKPLLKALAEDGDMDVARRCAELLEKRLAANRPAAEKHLPIEISQLIKAEARLKSLGGQRFPKLLEWIGAHTTVKVDPEMLARFGTDLTALAQSGALPHAHCMRDRCDTIVKLLRRDKWRSIALVGPAGCGKSALVNELVYELARPENGAWRVLRISPSDFMSGTRYLGEWETKVKEVIEAVKKPRRVVIYVPNLSDLSAAGTWSRSNSSVATAFAPYLEDGSVLMLGESAPEEFERGIGRTPSLQRLFDRVQIVEADAAQTLKILEAVRDEEKLPIADNVLMQLQEISSQFLSHISPPGNAVALLRTVIQHARDAERDVTFRDVLDSLSRSSGIPAELLDDTRPLKQHELRAFFEKKIIGQPEALEAVIDVITLVKAGLTDPGKPLAILLFIGPTGVGKTELARVLAEFIFGDAARLKRFDMSEFATSESYLRLLGSQFENGLLSDAVRQHPFSVVLLDEIEKSHANVFDLCLQIFDAGRLTDGRGRTVDFRRTIVILTSNIGATAPGTPLGFGNTAGTAQAEVDKDRTFRELSRFFRPEFLNRLDRIVQFRPLSLEVAEQIARREAELVLRRSGIRRRGLNVDIDPAVISLLVRDGYSAHFGARPLKRTVERLLLLPLARAIAGGGIPDRGLLHVGLRDGRIDLSGSKLAAPKKQSPEGQKRAGESLAQQAKHVLGEFDGLRAQVRLLGDRKSELLQATQEPGFYRDAQHRAATFDEIHKLDQFLNLFQGLGKALTGVCERLDRDPPKKNEEAALEERIDQLASELAQLRFVANCKDARELGDVLLCVTLVERSGAPQEGVEKLAGMYEALAKRRRMSLEVLGEFFDEKRDQAWLAINGLGAFALVKDEAGLHQLDHRFRERIPRAGHEAVREYRETIRIEIFPLANEPDAAFRKQVKAKVTALKPAHSRLLPKADTTITLFHETSLRSLELWTAGPRDAAIERGLLVLRSQIESASAESSRCPTEIIRHYDLGLSARVRDIRSGKSTTRVDRVLKGDLSFRDV